MFRTIGDHVLTAHNRNVKKNIERKRAIRALMTKEKEIGHVSE